MEARAEGAFVEQLFTDIDVRFGSAVPCVQETGDDGGEVRQYRNRSELVVCHILAGIAVAYEE